MSEQTNAASARAAYHADTGAIHASAIKYGRKSMKAMRAYITGQIKREPSAAMRLGTLVHLAVLEPERFAAEVVVFDGATRRGKEWDAFLAANDGAQIVKADEKAHIQAIRDAVLGHAAAREIVDATRHEVRLDWTDPAYGRAGALVDLLGDGFIADLKTTTTVDERAFCRQCFNLGYFEQMAWYRRGAGVDGVKIIAVETSAPFDVAVYSIAGMCLDPFYRKAAAIASEYRECERVGYFPGAAEVEREMSIEPWMLDAGDGGVDFGGMDEIEAAGL